MRACLSLLPLLLALTLGATAGRAPAQTGAPPAPAKPAASSAAAPQPKKTAAPAGATFPAAQAKPAPAPAPPTDAVALAWKLLVDGAAASKYFTRSDAISALTVLSTDRRAIGMIEGALGDSSVRIRVQAAGSLGELKSRASIPALRAALDDKSPEVSFAAARALWEMGDRSGRNYLYQILEGSRKAQPGALQRRLTKARRDLEDPKAMMLIGINAASGAFLGPGAMGVSAMEDFAIDKAGPVQALCARLLAEDDTPETAATLRAALDDKKWIIRAAAARALARMNHTEALPQLAQMMTGDKKEAARFAAAAAVIRLSALRAAPAPPAPPK